VQLFLRRGRVINDWFIGADWLIRVVWIVDVLRDVDWWNVPIRIKGWYDIISLYGRL
jgi:hypothetical protein